MTSVIQVTHDLTKGACPGCGAPKFLHAEKPPKTAWDAVCQKDSLAKAKVHTCRVLQIIRKLEEAQEFIRKRDTEHAMRGFGCEDCGGRNLCHADDCPVKLITDWKASTL